MVFYDVEEPEMFWESLFELESLGNDELVGRIVGTLAGKAKREPKRAHPNAHGIRLVKAPDARINGAIALRLAYFLDETPKPNGAAGTVVLLHVEPYDEQVELTEANVTPFGEPWH